MAKASTKRRQDRHWPLAAAVLLTAILATVLAESATAAPKLKLQSNKADVTIQPGKTSTLKVPCRSGQQFLSTRFRSISPPSDPSDPLTRPAFQLLGMVPEPKGTTLTLKNTGLVPVEVRGTVDCTKLKGKSANRGTGATTAKKKKPKLTWAERDVFGPSLPLCAKSDTERPRYRLPCKGELSRFHTDAVPATRDS